MQLLQSRLDRIDELNKFLGDYNSANRYWNTRRLIESQELRPQDFSSKTGIHTVYCSQLFSKTPVKKITYAMARTVELAFSLPERSLDERAIETPFEPEARAPATQISDEAISFLGTGAYLNRLLHIKNFCVLNHISGVDLHEVAGFKARNANDKLGDPPRLPISYDSARAFESRFKLAKGSIDGQFPGFDYESHFSIFKVSTYAFNLIGRGESLNRYVNLRYFMTDRGLNLADLGKEIGKTKAHVHSILSDRPIYPIGNNSARSLENALGLVPMSLDHSVTFTLEDPKAPLKRRQAGQAEGPQT